jgi:hypothetical protein
VPNYYDLMQAENVKFQHAPLKQPTVLITVAKSGSHLVRNILCMFMPWEQQEYGHTDLAPIRERKIITHPSFRWGHIPLQPNSANVLQNAKKILLVRDPYKWVLSMARFATTYLVSGRDRNYQPHPNDSIYKEKGVTLDELLSIIITGADIRNQHPSVRSAFVPVAVAWSTVDVHLIRYEDICGHVKALNDGTDTDETKEYFRQLVGAFNIDLPDDWKARVLAGSDRRISMTARENLRERYEIPNELPEKFKKLVNFTAPGLREYFNYE